MTRDSLSRVLEEFLGRSRHAVVLEGWPGLMTWLTRNIPARASSTSAFFIHGRRRATPSGEHWMPRSAMASCV